MPVVLHVCTRRLRVGARWETWALEVDGSAAAAVAVERDEVGEGIRTDDARPRVFVEELLPEGSWVVKFPVDGTSGDADASLGHEVAVLDRAAGPGVPGGARLVRVVVPGTRDGARVGSVCRRAHGVTLAEAATGDTPVDAAALVAATARLVARLHDLGIVHGDLSPHNVLVDTGGVTPEVTVIDFGAAVFHGSQVLDCAPEGTPATAGAVVGTSGTPGFVAPEVVAGQVPTPAADVWALGRLAGWVRDRFLVADPDAARIFGAWGDALCVWDPAARPDDLVAAADVLVALAGDPSESATTVEFGPRPLVEAPTVTPSGRRRHVVAAAATGGVVALMVALAAFALLRASSGGVRPTARHRTGGICSTARPPVALDTGRWQQVALDASGCPRTVRWEAGVLRVRSGADPATPERRYRLGQTGDRVFVGRFGCDGIAAVVLYRPGTGSVFTWRSLPDTSASAPPTRVAVPRDRPARVGRDAEGCPVVRLGP